jgi:hypothetical protein
MLREKLKADNVKIIEDIDILQVKLIYFRNGIKIRV